jgi:hypothetical protein
LLTSCVDWPNGGEVIIDHYCFGRY